MCYRRLFVVRPPSTWNATDPGRCPAPVPSTYLPTHRLFSPQAMQLVCRSVAASTGDLRHALKACRAAVDELEQQHQQEATAAAAAVTSAQLGGGSQDGSAVPAAAGPAASLLVGPRQMSVALARLAGVRSGQFGAQAASIIRSLPNQQQMLLYSLAVFCQQQPQAQQCGQASAAGADPVTLGSKAGSSGKAAASSLWKGAGSASLLSSCAGAGSGGSSPAAGSWSAGLKGKKKKAAVAGSGQGGAQGASVFALAVTADAAYRQYMQVGASGRSSLEQLGCATRNVPRFVGECSHCVQAVGEDGVLAAVQGPTLCC